jgi:hypothetical protein
LLLRAVVPGVRAGAGGPGTLAVDRGLQLSVAWGSRAPSRRSVERRRVRVRPSRARRSARRQVVVDRVKGDLRRVRNATAAYSDNTGSARLTVDATAIDTTRTAGVSSLAKGREARTLACPAARRPRSRPHQARRRRVRRRRPARRRRGEAARRRLPAHGRDRRSRGPEPQRPPRRCRLRCGQCALEAAQRPDELPPAVRPPARTSSGSRVSIPNLVTPITLPFSTPAPPAHVIAQQYLRAHEDRRLSLAVTAPLRLRTVGGKTSTSCPGHHAPGSATCR